MNVQPSLNIDPGGSSLSLVSSLPYNTSSLNQSNNNLHNNNIKLKNTKKIFTSSRFALSQSSPTLQSSDQLISIASLNVRGISVSSKFDSLLQDFTLKNLSVVALQETRIQEVTGSLLLQDFRSSCHSDYHAFWSFDSSDSSGGVGFLLRNFVFKHVQRVHHYGSRFIAVDLFFSAKKIKLVNVYNHQSVDFSNKGLALSKYIISHLKQARTDGFKVIDMGDFNLDPDVYFHNLESGHSIPKCFSLVDFLDQSDYTDIHPVDSSGLEFATHYNPDGSIPTSRIDLLWQSSDFLHEECVFSQVWQPPSSISASSSTTHVLDHRCIVAFFSMSLFLGFLPLHRVKQQGLWRVVYDVALATDEQWTAYSNHILSLLSSEGFQDPLAINSSLPSVVINLNTSWNFIKSTILTAASSCLPVKRISPESLSKSRQDSDLLLSAKSQLRTINKIFAFLTRLLYLPSNLSNDKHRTGAASRLNTNKVQDAWFSPNNERKAFYVLLTEINQHYDNFIISSDIPQLLPCHPIDFNLISHLRGCVAGLRTLVIHHCDALESKLKIERISMYEQLRCDNFVSHKSAFIASSLGRSRRFITLDRAMRVNADGSESLLVDPADVKAAAIDHFKTIAGLPPSYAPDMSTFPLLWRDAYLPLEHLEETIYDDLLKPVTVDEFQSVLSSLPNGKAAGH